MMNSSSKNVIREIDLQITTCKKIDREPNMRKLLTGLHITFKPERCTDWTVNSGPSVDNLYKLLFELQCLCFCVSVGPKKLFKWLHVSKNVSIKSCHIFKKNKNGHFIFGFFWIRSVQNGSNLQIR